MHESFVTCDTMKLGYIYVIVKKTNCKVEDFKNPNYQFTIHNNLLGTLLQYLIYIYI